MSDAAKLSDFVINVRRMLDQCSAGGGVVVIKPLQLIDLQEKCREVRMIADRLQKAEDDGK